LGSLRTCGANRSNRSTQVEIDVGTISEGEAKHFACHALSH